MELTYQIDIEIDKLTNSIENALTGETFDTDVIQMDTTQLKQVKKADWLFDWGKEIKQTDRAVYKLVTVQNPTIVQGLLSLSDMGDHVYMHLIESAKFNKYVNKMYKGVPGNLVAFACKMAFEKKYDGVVSFVSKSQLVEHYKTSLGAKQFSGNRMFIDTKESYSLVKNYFKTFEK
jgi:hypothetical protein